MSPLSPADQPIGDYTVVIPARFASQRLPGKPLVDIHGKPMIQRVYEQAQKSGAQRIVIATDHHAIYSAAKSMGAEVLMTRDDHPSGTDRLQEVAERLGLSDEHRIVNVQGDEPLIPPELIDQVALNLANHADAAIATLSTPIDNDEECHNRNAVKVVTDHQGYALYFSRATLPWDRSEQWLRGGDFWHRHLGIYAYRVGFLHRYVQWPPAPLERLECLEQLRALYNGVKIHVDTARAKPPAGVDTEEDLERVRRAFESCSKK